MRADLDAIERHTGCSARWTGLRQRVVASLLALLAVIACSGPAPTLQAPTISSFAANPDAIENGEVSTLTWHVVGATSLTLSPNDVDVTGWNAWPVAPTESTTYTLLARNEAGERSRQVAVVVQGTAPTIASFTADPEQVPQGGSSTLSWTVSGANTLTLLPDDVDVTGQASWIVAPEVTTTYTLVAANSTGVREEAATVFVGDLPTIESFAPVGELVNPGLPITVAWLVADADSVTLEGPGLPVRDVGPVGSLEVMPPVPGATYFLRATNDAGPVEATAMASRAVPAFSVLIAGQSNAKGSNISASEALAFIKAESGVWMLGNDYEWKVAYEPTGDCVGHVDLVSIDPRDRTEACTELEQNVAGVSPGVSLANHVAAATGGEVFIVPAAVFGSALNGSRANDNWQPPSDAYDTATLFGSAANRARLSGTKRGAPLGYTFGDDAYGAVLWYQGESDATTSKVEGFYVNTENVLAGFEDVLGARIIIVQLSSRGIGPNLVERNLLYQEVREVQRSMAQGAQTVQGGDASEARPGRHLVVTHDLEMSDGSHLSAEGQFELGRRVSLAVREHLLGEDVDGTGPRLERVEKHSSTVVRVVLDREVTAPASTGPGAYSGYFAAFAGGDEVEISQIVRDHTDSSVVRITLATTVADDVEVEVRYMPPPEKPESMRLDVVRSASCTDPILIQGTSACLPLPAFGTAKSASTASALRLMVIEDDDKD